MTDSRDSQFVFVRLTPENHDIRTVDFAIQQAAARTLGENADYCTGMEASLNTNYPLSRTVRDSILSSTRLVHDEIAHGTFPGVEPESDHEANT